MQLKASDEYNFKILISSQFKLAMTTAAMEAKAMNASPATM